MHMKFVGAAAGRRCGSAFVFCAVFALAASAASAADADGIFAGGFDESWDAGARTVDVALPGQLSLSGRLYLPPAALRHGGAVVLVHGCNGLWSRYIVGGLAQGAIEKWGSKLAAEGYVALAPDSYGSARAPAGADPVAFQVQCSGSLYAGAVNPYTTRVDDIDTGMRWLHYRLGALVRAGRVGVLGWSQGAEAAMTRAAETSRRTDVSLYPDAAAEAAALPATVLFYPGCGRALEFIAGNAPMQDSFWRPHRDLRMNHGGGDDLHGNCAIRAATAQTIYAATPGSGHWMQYVEYTDAPHSFDGDLTQWPAAYCGTQPLSPGACAAADADIDSLNFFNQRLRP